MKKGILLLGMMACCIFKADDKTIKDTIQFDDQHFVGPTGKDWLRLNLLINSSPIKNQYSAVAIKHILFD